MRLFAVGFVYVQTKKCLFITPNMEDIESAKKII